MFAAVVGALALGAVGVATSGVRWEECRACGVQRYDRRLFGVRVGAGDSESEYDEYGSSAAWKSAHGAPCRHTFTPVDRAKGPVAATWPHG